MKYKIKHFLLLSVGWLFFALGIIGLLLPVMPTVPFMIVAAACFARTSPRFHDMLMNNRWIGPALRQWDQTRTISRRSKVKAVMMLCLTFSISLLMFWGNTLWQIILIAMALTMIGIVLRLKEGQSKYEH